MNAFIKKFAPSIVATLRCFDRVLFKGHLPFGGDAHLNAFVDNVLKIRRKDFIPMLEKLSGKLVGHAKSLAPNPWRKLPAGPTSTTRGNSARRPTFRTSSVVTLSPRGWWPSSAARKHAAPSNSAMAGSVPGWPGR